jgi:predicted HAD superfamily Cof-like phosphohydrolase
MIIVVEGTDNSGKTTLAHRLAKDLSRGIYLKSEIKPNDAREVLTFHRLVTDVERNFATPVLDRHHAISGPIYDRIIRQVSRLDEEAMKEICRGLVVIYCRPPDERLLDFKTEQMDGVIDHQRELIAAYDGLMSSLLFKRLYIYDYTDDDYYRLFNSLTEVRSEYQDVRDFQNKFLIPMPTQPTLMNDELYQFRAGFLEEEVEEFKSAHTAGDLHGAADALVDLAYVLYGTALLMGLPWRDLWERVHAANMMKVRAQNASESKRGSHYDVIKPKGWKAPDFSGLLP